MADIFKHSVRVGWGDVDFNAHMRNTAYLDSASTARVIYFETQGLPVGEFQRRRIGPVVLRDTLEYRRELLLMDHVDVTLELAGMSEDGSRWRFFSSFFRATDGSRAATLATEGGWMDLNVRHLVAPPPEILEAVNAMSRTEDFQVLPSSVAGKAKPGAKPAAKTA